jgi:two-component system chemotaxis sensor kinase CheA
LEPEQCYVAFTSVLRTVATDEQVHEVFTFVEDTCVVETIEDSAAPIERRVPANAAFVTDTHVSPALGSTLRVATAKVDALIDLVGEIVIAQSMVRQLLQTSATSVDPALQDAVSTLENNTQELQARVMAIRMVPVATVFARFPRIVRDLSAKLGKSVSVEIEGGETELDKGVVERLSDPLTHLVRNAVDHGIESATERLAHGKPALGTIRLTAQHSAGGITIEVCEDGRGLDINRIRARAEAMELVSPGEPISDEQLHNLIFEPGFSTAETVSDISGRGVGMDVVKRAIDSLNGSITIVTEAKKGTIFRIKLPLTLAILDGLTLGVGQQTFIIPLLSVAESLRPTAKEYKRVVGQGEVIIVRGRTLPLIRLHERFGIPGAELDPTRGLVVVAETDAGHVGILVDMLLGESQVVLKSLEAHYQRIQGVLGATILGDGHVALILDIPGLVRTGARCSGVRKPDAA